MLKEFILVFLGGGLGRIVRFGIARWLSQWTIAAFSFATMRITIVSSLLIGVFWGFSFISDKTLTWPLLTIGFCGGFTTFSAFSWESFNLLK